MRTEDLKINDEFYFRGDWQTEPSEWVVIGHDADYSVVECLPKEGGEVARFHYGVTVDVR